ncbi:hypothetical protein FACS1894184_05940 [Clostridia bacterium]|nr:hypothetical protein FACS1894184_05940 [Clostridia bacterium]
MFVMCVKIYTAYRKSISEDIEETGSSFDLSGDTEETESGLDPLADYLYEHHKIDSDYSFRSDSEEIESVMDADGHLRFVGASHKKEAEEWEEARYWAKRGKNM